MKEDQHTNLPEISTKEFIISILKTYGIEKGAQIICESGTAKTLNISALAAHAENNPINLN